MSDKTVRILSGGDEMSWERYVVVLASNTFKLIQCQAKMGTQTCEQCSSKSARASAQSDLRATLSADKQIRNYFTK